MVGTTQNNVPSLNGGGQRATGIAFVSVGANFNVTGFTDGVDGRELVIWSGDPNFSLTILSENLGSALPNRIRTPNGAPYVLLGGGSVKLYYDVDSLYWRVVANGV